MRPQLFKANERQTKSAFWSPILIKIIGSALICRKVLTLQTLQLAVKID